jgi:TonB family protein
VGALAQERAKTLPPSQGEPQSRERIMIAPVPGGEIPMQEGGLVFGGQGDYGFAFVSSEMSFDSKVVKGAPFTADAVTETVQALADGNHITRTTSTRLFRDSEGRTRREQSLNGIGTWATNDNAPQAIFINDPVAGVNYVLNTKTHTAQKAMQFFFTRGGEGEPSQGVWKSGEKVVVNSGGAPKQLQIDGGTISGKAIKKVQPDYPPVARAAGAQGEVTVEVVVGEDGNIESAKAISGHPLLQQAAVDAARQWQFKPTTLEGKPVKVRGRISFVFSMEKDQPGAGAATDTSAAAHERAVAERAAVERGVQQKFQQTHESLGKQTVEGVEAEGTRNTITIPAGTIGNERAIQIVSERWYSAELQTVVMTKHSDPRFGETTYRLTNISRGEPDHSLFELPTGYTITDRGSIERRTIMREPQQEP